MPDLAVLVIVGVGTYLMRAVFLVIARPEPPAVLARVLPQVGPAVLAAIAVPVLVAPHGTLSVVDTVPALAAAAVAWALWAWRKSLPLALFAALAAGWLVGLALP